MNLSLQKEVLSPEKNDPGNKFLGGTIALLVSVLIIFGASRAAVVSQEHKYFHHMIQELQNDVRASKVRWEETEIRAITLEHQIHSLRQNIELLEVQIEIDALRTTQEIFQWKNTLQKR